MSSATYYTWYTVPGTIYDVLPFFSEGVSNELKGIPDGARAGAGGPYGARRLASCVFGVVFRAEFYVVCYIDMLCVVCCALCLESSVLGLVPL